MLTMIFSELYKVFSRKLFLILFIVLLLFNGFFIYNGQIKGNDLGFVSAKAKISLDRNIQRISDNSKRIEFVESKLNLVYNDGASLYTGESYSDRKLLENAKTQLDIVSDYNSYVQSVIAESENITGVSVFADNNSFAYKNATKTADDYSTLLNVQTSYDNSYGVNMATDFLLTDLIVILLLCVVCDALIGTERSINITGLQRTCPHGRSKLALSEITAAFITTAVICIFFYGMNYIISGFTYGFGDISRAIQSVEGFANCTLKISVLQFLLLLFAAKLLVMFMICLIINALSMLSKSKIGGYSIFIGLFIFSYILYAVIEDNTGAMLLKYLNLVTFVETRSVFSAYKNINLFGNPANYTTVFWLFLLVFLTGFIALNILIYKYKRISGYNKYAQSLLSIFRFHHGGTNVVAHEMYKTLVINKAGLIFLMIILLQIVVNITSPLILNEEEKYEKYYFTYFSGEFNDDKREEIETEIENFEKNENSIATLTDDYEKGLISNEEYSQAYAQYSDTVEEYQKFNKYVTPYYEFLCNQTDSEKVVSVIPYKGYSIILGLSGDLSNIYCLVLYVLIVICVVPIITGEYEKETIHLLSSTKTGLKRLILKKLVCAEAITLILNVLVYLPYFIRVINAYGISDINSSACSIPAFGNFPDNISVLQVIVFAFVVRVLVSLIITVIVSGISIVAKNTVISSIISMLFFVIPVLLPLNNINILNGYSLFNFQNFSVLI